MWRPILPLAALLLLPACSDGPVEPSAPPSSTPETFTLRGSLTLDGSLFIARPAGELFDSSKIDVPAGTGCTGSGGFDDIEAGASVTVFDGSNVVGLGRLGPGKVVSAFAHAHSEADGTCRFAFEVSKVPVGPAFYSVEVSHRGKVNVTADEARGPGVSLTLG